MRIYKYKDNWINKNFKYNPKLFKVDYVEKNDFCLNINVKTKPKYFDDICVSEINRDFLEIIFFDKINKEFASFAIDRKEVYEDYFFKEEANKWEYNLYFIKQDILYKNFKNEEIENYSLNISKYVGVENKIKKLK